MPDVNAMKEAMVDVLYFIGPLAVPMVGLSIAFAIYRSFRAVVRPARGGGGAIAPPSSAPAPRASSAPKGG